MLYLSLVSRFLVEIFNSTQYTGNILYSIMNKELIIRQLTFVGFVAGTIILFLINDVLLYELTSIDYLEHLSGGLQEIVSLGLTVLQVWLVTKYLHK